MKIALVALYGQVECKMVLCATPPPVPPTAGTNTGEDLFYREISSLKSYLQELEARIECMEQAHSGRTTVTV